MRWKNFLGFFNKLNWASTMAIISQEGRGPPYNKDKGVHCTEKVNVCSFVV